MEKKNEIKNKNFGFTFEYSTYAYIFIFVGLVNFWFYIYLAIGLVILGLITFLIRTGIQVKLSEQKIRTYNELFGFKIGDWSDLTQVEQIELNYTSNAKAEKKHGEVEDFDNEDFEIVLRLKNDSLLELVNFGDYKLAKENFTWLIDTLKLPSKNIVEEIMEKAFERRKLRGR
jgi:hypothetical protein